MKRLLVVALLLLGCRGQSPDSDFELTILHTNDVHARLIPFNRFGSTCSVGELEEGVCFGGAARRATKIAQLRAEREHVLLLDGGDQFQGTLFFNRYKGLAAQRVMNHLRYDAMVVGNHEFDDGPEVLARFIDGLDFPVLGANVDTSQEPALRGHILSHSLVNMEGETIALLGALTEETTHLSQPGETLRFLPIEETLTPLVAELEAQGIDKIILLSHSGLVRDRKIASTVDGIDVIIGGHTNTLLSNIAENAEGPYPVVERSPSGEPVLIVQDFAWGKYLGDLRVVFDRQGVPEAWHGEPILLDSSVPDDPEVASLLAEMSEAVEAFADVIVGTAAVDLVGDENVCRFAECNLGNLITDALLEEHPDAEIALQNAGGIRSSIGRGDVSVGQVLEVLPFGNTVSSFELRGADLLATLEHGASEAEDPDNENTGRFLQVSGLRYTWTPSAPPGERILSAEVRNPNGLYQPVDPERLYRCLSNSFSRSGGDGFSVLAERAIDPYDAGRVMADVVQDYIAEHSPVSPAIEGRILRQP